MTVLEIQHAVQPITGAITPGPVTIEVVVSMVRSVVQTRDLSVAAAAVAICAVASVASPWSVSIPPGHISQSFGFQTPACWAALLALVAAVVLDGGAAVAAVGIALAVIAGWFAWAMWIVTTAQFTSLPFPFVGTDVIGPGWYAAAVGLLIAAAAVARSLARRHAPAGIDLWVLTTIPGYGLMRLGSWGRGLIFTVLFSAALYFGSTDSPDPAQFADYGQSGNVPPPLPRGPEWVLLGLAAAIWLASVAVTVVHARRESRAEPL